MHRLLRLWWRWRKPRTFGAHAVAVTPRGTILLVKLRYARGWRVPGGGRKAHEDPQEAALRELREEVGMTCHGEVRAVGELEERVHSKRDHASLFLVLDVEYRPRWSLEVEEVIEARLDSLPHGTTPGTRRWLRLAARAL